MALLTFVKGANQGSHVDLKEDRMVLGRNADCQIVLNVPAVSREHAVIRKIQGKFFIEDMKSRNGTFVNNKEVTARTQLKDNDRIKICDNILAFFEVMPLAPLPEEMRTGEVEAEEEPDSSTVEATLSSSNKQVLEAQPAEKLAMLLEISAELAQTFQVDELLPKIVEHLFQVFRQADRGFIILEEDGKLIPKVIKTRRTDDNSDRFSRKIVTKCLETKQAVLSEDASADKRFDLSQSIADCRIRSVMCVPLASRSSGRAIGVVQLDTQDRFKKFNQDDLKLLLAVSGQAAIALENAQMHQSLVARAGLERDLKLAHQVQLSFLPKRPPQIPGYEFYAHYESALEVGGDYYDFIPVPSSRVGIMVGDVAGKGVPAALLMAKVSSDARYCMLTEKSPAEAITKLNLLLQEAGMLDKFVTLGMALVDPIRHEATFVNAGHLDPLVYRKAENKFVEAAPRDASGPPLGVVDEYGYESVTVPIHSGDCILLITDGIPDVRNKEEVQFQMENVLPLLAQGPLTPKSMGERLVSAVRQHALGCKQVDDITVVAFGRI